MSIRISSFFVCVLCGISGTVRMRYPNTVHSTSEENTALLKHAGSISSPGTSTKSCSVLSVTAERLPCNAAWGAERGAGRAVLGFVEGL